MPKMDGYLSSASGAAVLGSLAACQCAPDVQGDARAGFYERRVALAIADAAAI